MEDKSTFGLRLDQMAGLFAMGVDEPDPAAQKHDDEVLRDLLTEQLNSLEPRNSLLRDTLVMMIERDGGHAGALKDRPLGAVLLDPQSDVHLLDAIKEASKALSGSLESRTETAMAKTLYFAAIAVALLCHDAKITRISYTTLADSLTMLMEKNWMAPELIERFSQARQICRSRSEQI